jgi:hypothetical protein
VATEIACVAFDLFRVVDTAQVAGGMVAADGAGL